MNKSIWKRRLSAFTLLECLVGLLVMSGLCVYLSLYVKQVKALQNTIERNDLKEWHLFQQQLGYELTDTTDITAFSNSIRYKKNTKSYYIEQYGTQIRKRSISGGHQPMLTNIASFRCTETEQFIELMVTFHDGGVGYSRWIKESKNFARKYPVSFIDCSFLQYDVFLSSDGKLSNRTSIF